MANSSSAPVRLVHGTSSVAPKPEPLLSLRGVGLKLGEVQILKGIDLDIRKGEFVCVVGPSGCGKTTLLRLLSGLRPPTEGAVCYAGKPVVQPSREIALVFQDYGKALLPWRTAEGNISLALETTGYPREKRRERIRELLQLVGLDTHSKRFPKEMSGGMQQRLQIARALALEPSVLLLDEPFGALDAMTRQGLQDEMLALVRSSGATAFFVTHDLEEAIYLGDRVIGLNAHPGRIGISLEIDLPTPRNQLETRELPDFLRLRHELFSFIKGAEAS